MSAPSMLTSELERYVEKLNRGPLEALYRASWLDAHVTVAFGSHLSAAWARYYLSPYVHLEQASSIADDIDLWVHYREPDWPADLGLGSEVLLHSRRSGTLYDHGRFLVVARHDIGAQYVVDRHRGRAHIVLSSLTPESIREPARHVRELLANAATTVRSYRPLHCAGLASDDGVVLLVAAKGGGKTSTLIQALASGAVDYFCNDRALIGSEGDAVRVYPYPLSCRIGAGTAFAHPQLSTHFHGFDHTLGRVLPLSEQLAHPDKLELTPMELGAILDVRIRTDSLPVVAVVEPNMVLDGRAPEVHRLAGDDTRHLLEDNVLVPDADRLSWLADEVRPRQQDKGGPFADVPAFRVTGSAQQICDVALAQLATVDGTAATVAAGRAAAPVDRWERRPLRAQMVVIMEHRRADRGLTLSPFLSRAVRRDDVHEFIVTARGEGFLKAVGYLGFAAFVESGVLVKGDRVSVNGHCLGTIVGFDLCHADNHLNVVIESTETELDALPTGHSLGLALDTELNVERP